jgi:hypothetical protein
MTTMRKVIELAQELDEVIPGRRDFTDLSIGDPVYLVGGTSYSPTITYSTIESISKKRFVVNGLVFNLEDGKPIAKKEKRSFSVSWVSKSCRDLNRAYNSAVRRSVVAGKILEVLPKLTDDDILQIYKMMKNCN